MGSPVFLLLFGIVIVWLAMSGKFQAMMAVINSTKTNNPTAPKSP